MFNLVATIIPALLWGITALHVHPCVLQVNYSLFFRYFVQLYKIVIRISGSKRAVLVRQMTRGTTPASFSLWTGQKAVWFYWFTLSQGNKSGNGEGEEMLKVDVRKQGKRKGKLWGCCVPLQGNMVMLLFRFPSMPSFSISTLCSRTLSCPEGIRPLRISSVLLVPLL